MGKLGKHDHKLTNLLKAGIFSLIMLAPLISIGVRCLYVINNKNAYESYSDNYISSVETISNSNQLLNNGNYVFNANTYKENWTSGTYVIAERLYITNSNINWSLYFDDTTIAQIDSVQFQTQNIITQLRIRLYDDNNSEIGYLYNFNYWDIFPENTLMTISQFTNPISNQYGLSLLTYKENKLDNVFEYSVKQLEEQSTFNWVQNTAIYVPLNAMCSGLGITESAIPILLCYWALMTAIYIVFDIIIYLFTKMTHFIGTN